MMQLGRNSRKVAGVLSGLALCVSSTGAIAAPAPHPAAISPFVALSALGSGVSAAALCGSSAVSGAAAVAQGAAQGCVLPAVDPAAPAAVAETAPPPPYVAEPVAPMGGAAVSPLLLALVGIAAAVGLYYLVFRGNDNFHIIFPESPA
jgi:hypothetical protein